MDERQLLSPLPPLLIFSQVSHAGKTYDLRVTELQPESAVSVIDTDVAVEVVASEETENLIRAFEEEQQANEARWVWGAGETINVWAAVVCSLSCAKVGTGAVGEFHSRAENMRQSQRGNVRTFGWCHRTMALRSTSVDQRIKA